MEGQDQLDLEAFEMHLGAVAALEGEIMLGWAGNGLTWVEDEVAGVFLLLLGRALESALTSVFSFPGPAKKELCTDEKMHPWDM